MPREGTKIKQLGNLMNHDMIEIRYAPGGDENLIRPFQTVSQRIVLRLDMPLEGTKTMTSTDHKTIVYLSLRLDMPREGTKTT